MRPFDVSYDIETYPNIFTLTLQFLATKKFMCFEISDRKNQLQEMLNTLAMIRDGNGRMFGFYSMFFDYPVLHYIIQNKKWITVADIYAKAMQVIETPDYDKYSVVIRDYDEFIPQVDMFKVHHFDNPSRRTSLKVIEFCLQMESIEDLPFAPGSILNDEQKDILIKYNAHDVEATSLFVANSAEEIKMREELTEKFGINFMNKSNVSLGTTILINQIEKKNKNACYEFVDGRRRVRQTHRASVPLREVIFPYIKFEDPEFRRVLHQFDNTIITDTKDAFTASAILKGFRFDFGTGGIHGSVDSCRVLSNDEYVIVDLDVTSFYPSLSIENNVYPAHIGPIFCEAYAELKIERLKHLKGSSFNTAYKFGLNGTFGNSNSDFSPFLDPAFMLAITVNGQLLLCMLAEQLAKIPSLKIIQANTDGITVRLKRNEVQYLKQITDWWQNFTKLQLEDVEYSSMWIRDVNNYIAQKAKDGKLKRKGAYLHTRPWEPNPDLDWSKDHSKLIVPKAAEAALVHGVDVRDFIMSHKDARDFMIRQRAPRGSKFVLNYYGGPDYQISNTVRYYVAKTGPKLTKVMPPLYHKGKTEPRRIDVESEYVIGDCTHSLNADLTNINYDYYVREAEKLVKPCLTTFS